MAHKLARDNSRLHRNYILLTARSFTWVSTVSVYNARTRLEPAVSSSGFLVAEAVLRLFGSELMKTRMETRVEVDLRRSSSRDCHGMSGGNLR